MDCCGSGHGHKSQKDSRDADLAEHEKSNKWFFRIAAFIIIVLLILTILSVR